jgi:nucleoprotein TPR
VEKNFRNYKESHSKNTEIFKTRLGAMNAEKSAFKTERENFNAKVAALESEVQTLRDSQATSDAEKANNVQDTSAEVSAQATTIVRYPVLGIPFCSRASQEALRMERDALLAEKSTWVANTSTTPASADSEEMKRTWEAEKAELVQARDAAQAEAKV